MRFFIIVDQLADWNFTLQGIEVITAKDYLTNEEIAQVRHARVFNLCRSYRYQSFGYYVSLLAEARGHKPMPNVQTVSDLKSPAMTRFASDELEEMIQQSLKHLKSDKFTLSIYFGKNVNHTYDRLSTPRNTDLNPASFISCISSVSSARFNDASVMKSNRAPVLVRHSAIARSKSFARALLPMKLSSTINTVSRQPAVSNWFSSASTCATALVLGRRP